VVARLCASVARATGPNALWIAAESNVVRFWNGFSWFTPQSGLPGGTEVYAVAANETIGRAYLVGSGGAIAWGDVGGGDFTNEFGGGGFPGFPFPGGGAPPTTSDLYGVSMTANGHVFAAGDAGALVWTSGPGGVWQTTNTAPTTRDLRGVWAAGDDDAWAVGAGGTVVRFDGSDWAAVPSGVTDDLHAVWGAGPNLVWAAGANGRVIFYNGQHWTKETTASTETLRAISGVAGGETPYVFGDNNTFMQRQ